MSGFQIDAAEWRALFLENLQRIASFVAEHRTITPDELKLLHAHQDRGKVIVAAWCAAGPAGAQQAVTASSPADVPEEETLPVEPPKRKGGWPRGKPRGPKVRQKKREF